MVTDFNPYPVSNSRLTAFKKSPKHLIHYLTHRPEPTAAMRFGIAFHMALLQPELFAELYVTEPIINKRTKAGKEIWDQFVIDNPSKEVISVDDMDRINDMIESIMSDPIACDLITNLTHRECDVEWTDSETSVPMRGIIDGIGPDYVIDIKTCSDGTYHKFERDIMNMNYHRQAAIYLDSFIDEQPGSREYYIIAVESSAPHGISIHRLMDEMIIEGREQYRKYLHEYKTWIDLGMPNAGYQYWSALGINDVYLPMWAKTK